MKAILEFNLPEDRVQFNASAKATDMAMVLWEILYNIRKRAENEFDFRADKDEQIEYQTVIDFIFDEINKEMDGQGLIIDDLIE